MTKKKGNWIASWKCKICDGLGKIIDPLDSNKEKPCLNCTKGWIITKGNVN